MTGEGLDEVTTVDLCPDCGVLPGVAHEYGCDVARCLATGRQWIQCDGEIHGFNGRTYGEHEGSCGQDVWTGDWPGDVECREYGFWCYWQPPATRGESVMTASGGVCAPVSPAYAPHTLPEPLVRDLIGGRWVPCGPDHPDACEDLNRLVTECVWDREQQRYVRRTA